MANVSTSTTSILYGSKLKIGYRVSGSSDNFTYINYQPSYTELPYTFTISGTGTYEIEYTELCPVCQGLTTSTSTTTTVTLS